MSRSEVAWVVMAMVIVGGCGGRRPLHNGPDVAGVPEGFIYEGHLESGRNLFPDRPKVLERGYTTAAFLDNERSNITITQYNGPTTREQAEAALGLEQKHYGEQWISALETLKIDRQEAWAWTVKQPGDRWSNGSLTYRAVVSYPDASYLVEFYTSHKQFMDANRMRAVVASFEVND